MDTRTSISYLLIMGDSLTDRGTLSGKRLFFCIPMDFLSGIKNTAPNGSFTNGFPWSDHFVAALANEFTIKKLEKDCKIDQLDIADGIITHDKKITAAVQEFYDLKNDRYVDWHGAKFMRSFAEGGLTSHNYKWYLSNSIKRFFTRLIVATLEEKRAELLSDDLQHHTTKEQKENTLIIEWSGANDFITVNKEPSIDEANRIIAARINNVRSLIQEGYKHFILFNMPDLLLVPRMQKASIEERKNAKKCCDYLNKELEKAAKTLSTVHKNSTITVFDINAEFSNIYNHPKKFGFDPAKLTQPYITSTDFKMNKNKTSPATGYMFWDDVHPSADAHVILAFMLRKKLNLFYNFTPSKKKHDRLNMRHLREQFKMEY